MLEIFQTQKNLYKLIRPLEINIIKKFKINH